MKALLSGHPRKVEKNVRNWSASWESFLGMILVIAEFKRVFFSRRPLESFPLVRVSLTVLATSDESRPTQTGENRFLLKLSHTT